MSGPRCDVVEDNCEDVAPTDSILGTLQCQLSLANSCAGRNEAWKNFVPSDGMVTEFVPIVIGWFGEFGPAFQGFIDRVGSHFGDRSGSEKEMQFAAKWRSRRFAASVTVRHLNLIGGVYLNAKRESYGLRLGCGFRKRHRMCGRLF